MSNLPSEPSCDAHDGYVAGCVGCLRAWLDRKPPPQEPKREPDQRAQEEFWLKAETLPRRELMEAGHA